MEFSIRIATDGWIELEFEGDDCSMGVPLKPDRETTGKHGERVAHWTMTPQLARYLAQLGTWAENWQAAEDDQAAAGDGSQARALCMLLDYEAREALWAAVKKGHIYRYHNKKRGVALLHGLALIDRVKTTDFMHRYEPTELGREVAKYLPKPDAEWEHIMQGRDLVYGDGTVIVRGNVPRYDWVRDYHDVIRQAKHIVTQSATESGSHGE